ncbi:Uncharacterised protein [Mycobacteroides abscessus subsp. abscessus]|nr:Uncharacterised protein [Mycobacteroides abscessus subsp. abscessus]
MRADGEQGEEEDVHLRGVVERQRVDGPVVTGEVEAGQAREVLVDEGTVGHHRALGRRGRPRGVEQLRDVGVGDVEFVGRGRADVARRGGIEEGGQAPHLRRRPRGRRVHRLDEVVVGEDDLGPGVGEDVVEFVAGELEVHGHVDESRACAGEVEEEVEVGVLPVRRDPVALDRAEGEEFAGDRGDSGVEVGI